MLQLNDRAEITAICGEPKQIDQAVMILEQKGYFELAELFSASKARLN